MKLSACKGKYHEEGTARGVIMKMAVLCVKGCLGRVAAAVCRARVTTTWKRNVEAQRELAEKSGKSGR